MPVCSLCAVGETFPSIQALHIHYKIVHHMLPTSSYICAEQICLFKKSFGSWARMRRHYRCQHNFPNYSVPDHEGPIQQPDATHGDADSVMDANNADEQTDQNNVVDEPPGVNLRDANGQRQEKFKDLLTRQAAVFIAKLYSRPSFPRSLVQIVVDGLEEFLESSVGELRHRFHSAVKDLPLEEHSRNEFNDLLDVMSDPFSSLSSDYLRLKYFEKSGDLIPATDCKVGERSEDKLINNRIVKVTVPCLAKLISLRLLLKKFFELPGNLSTVLNYVEKLKRSDRVLCNFVQGELWKKKSAFYESQNKIVLPLFLGIDDLEVNNALGSHTGINEIGAAYVSIPCLPPEFLSRLDNIFLAFLYNSQDRKTYGNAKVFSHLIKELNFLSQEGIVIETESGDKRVFFILGLLLGDNKGLNEILGFSGSFSANYYCRFCKMHKSDCSKYCEENVHLLRKTDDYERDVSLGLQSVGVAEKSVWLGVDYFHPVENFASCTLHDFDEGVSRYGMAEICNYFVRKAKIFDLEVLNERMLGFNYQVNGFSNKPPTIRYDQLKDSHFTMSGSEMRTFVLCFNLLVGDYVPLDCEVWRYYLVLRRLVEYVSCRALPKQRLEIISNLVEEHNHLYTKLFGPLKPKMHFLLHYRRIISQSGPMPYLSMIRNEGKHKEVKESASATNSRRNAVHTFALKQQLKLCYLFASGRGLEDDLLTGRSYLYDSIESVEDYPRFSRTLPDSFKDKPVTKVKWVTYKGTTYREDTCVIMDICEDGIIPSFGVVKKILCNDFGEVCFVCLALFSSTYDFSMGAYEIKYSGELSCTLVTNLLSPFPAIKAVLSNGKMFACLRCTI